MGTPTWYAARRALQLGSSLQQNWIHAYCRGGLRSIVWIDSRSSMRQPRTCTAVFTVVCFGSRARHAAVTGQLIQVRGAVSVASDRAVACARYAPAWNSM